MWWRELDNVNIYREIRYQVDSADDLTVTDIVTELQIKDVRKNVPILIDQSDSLR